MSNKQYESPGGSVIVYWTITDHTLHLITKSDRKDLWWIYNLIVSKAMIWKWCGISNTSVESIDRRKLYHHHSFWFKSARWFTYFCKGRKLSYFIDITYPLNLESIWTVRLFDCIQITLGIPFDTPFSSTRLYIVNPIIHSILIPANCNVWYFFV